MTKQPQDVDRLGQAGVLAADEFWAGVSRFENSTKVIEIIASLLEEHFDADKYTSRGMATEIIATLVQKNLLP